MAAAGKEKMKVCLPPRHSAVVLAGREPRGGVGAISYHLGSHRLSRNTPPCSDEERARSLSPSLFSVRGTGDLEGKRPEFCRARFTRTKARRLKRGWMLNVTTLRPGALDILAQGVLNVLSSPRLCPVSPCSQRSLRAG